MEEISKEATKRGNRKRKFEDDGHHSVKYQSFSAITVCSDDGDNSQPDHPYAKDEDGNIQYAYSSSFVQNETTSSDSNDAQPAITRSISPHSRLEKAVFNLSEILKNAGIPAVNLTSSIDSGLSTPPDQTFEVSGQTATNDSSLDNNHAVYSEPPLNQETNTMGEQSEADQALPEMRQKALDGSLPLAKYCRIFLENRHQDGNVTCYICGLIMPVVDSDGLHGDGVFDHVRKHVDKPLLKCFLCDNTSSTVFMATWHLQKVHGNNSTSNLIDLSKTNVQYREELISMLERCFDNDSVSSDDSDVSESNSASAPERTQMPDENLDVSDSNSTTTPERSQEQDDNLDSDGSTNSPASPEINQVEEDEKKKKDPDRRQQALDGSITFVRYCRYFLKDRHQDGQVTCNICGMTLRVLYSKGIRGQLIWDHVGKHYGNPLLQCRLCDHKTFGIGLIRTHVKAKHGTAATGNFIDTTETKGPHREELISMLERCFGDHQHDLNDDEMLSLMEYMRRAAKDRLLDGFLRCAICDVSIRVANIYHQAWESYSSALEHAIKHVRPCLYSCRLCGHAVPSKCGALQHLVRNHGVAKNMDLMDDQTEIRQMDIKAVIDYCYGGLSIDQVSKYDIPKETMDHLYHARCQSFQLRCIQLIDKFGQNNRLTCLLCSKAVLIRSEKYKHITRAAIDHAAQHLGGQLYQCKHCSKWSYGQEAMSLHINQRHRVSASGGYVDHSYKYVDELLRMMDKCYDRRDISTLPGITVYENDDEPSTSSGKGKGKRNSACRKKSKEDEIVIKLD